MKKYLFALLICITLILCSIDLYPEEPIQIEMIRIPAGTFQMGLSSNYHDDATDFEKPLHQVTITKDYYISKFEITQKQYSQILKNSSYFKGDNLPVESISWFDAIEFCNELSKKEGLKPCYSGNKKNIECDWNANGYRLPTEAEWEYACKGKTNTDFYIGNITDSLCQLDNNLHKIAWYCGNSNNQTHPVGQKEPNSFGIFDMSGNVWEWCWDWYDDDYYSNTELTDPKGPRKSDVRVVRGGSWSYHARYCRSSSRFFYKPSFSNSYAIGFRVVRCY